MDTCLSCLFFFFFKQKTAYEMRISDWSSDVCSSDLHVGAAGVDRLGAGGRLQGFPDGDNLVVLSQHVGAKGVVRGDDGPASDADRHDGCPSCSPCHACRIRNLSVWSILPDVAGQSESAFSDPVFVTQFLLHAPLPAILTTRSNPA